MARATYLSIVNDVLRRLREGTVSSVTQTTYSTLIGEFVNEAKREVEESWNWSTLRTSMDITTASGTQTYAATGFGERHRIARVRNESRQRVVIESVDPDTFEGFTPSDHTGTPVAWRTNGINGSGDPILEFWPTPDATETIRVIGWVSGDDLSADGDTIDVPSWPVVLGAYRLAIRERGEDDGTSLLQAEDAFRAALDESIARDNSNVQGGRASDWLVV